MEDLIEHVQAETPLRPTEDEVTGFIQFLQGSQLLVPMDKEDRGKLRSRWMSGVKPWYEQLFHNYLFFRIPLVRPDKFLERTLPFAELFFTRSFFTVIFLVFLVDLYLVTREWDELRRTFAYFFNLQGGLYFAIAATFSKVLHELGHAYAAKRYGVRVPAMGVAFPRDVAFPLQRRGRNLETGRSKEAAGDRVRRHGDRTGACMRGDLVLDDHPGGADKACAVHTGKRRHG